MRVNPTITVLSSSCFELHGFHRRVVSPNRFTRQTLVVLSQEILRCEKPLTCQRWNTAVITRQIKVLSMLFETVKDVKILLPSSALTYASMNFISCNRGQSLEQRTHLENW
eukprot:Gb_05587 [translate_table: standard]